jgi:hypothetical protein
MLRTIISSLHPSKTDTLTEFSGRTDPRVLSNRTETERTGDHATFSDNSSQKLQSANTEFQQADKKTKKKLKTKYVRSAKNGDSIAQAIVIHHDLMKSIGGLTIAWHDAVKCWGNKKPFDKDYPASWHLDTEYLLADLRGENGANAYPKI